MARTPADTRSDVTYPEALQTISTTAAVVGVSSAVYATFLAHRVHATIQDIHETVKAQGSLTHRDGTD